MTLQHTFRKAFVKYKLGRIWWRAYSNNATSLVSHKEIEVYKYSCLVPYKNDNILPFEDNIYEDKYSHVFSENNVEIESNLVYLYKLLINSRSIEQIRLQIHNSFCAYEKNFINDVKNINWSLYIPFSNIYIEPQISITSIKSRLYHTCMLKNIILNVIKRQQQIYIEKNGDQNIFLKKKKINPHKLPPLKINVLFKYNELSIYINISNDLNKRIYEAYKSKQSLKGTIVASAAFKINLAKYINPTKKLYIIDPFCNDGTLIIELISILLSIPNGSPSISYPILTFPIHSPSCFYSVLNEINMNRNENLNKVYFLGIDENKNSIRQANENMKKMIETMPININEEKSNKDSTLSFIKWELCDEKESENNNSCNEYNKITDKSNEKPFKKGAISSPIDISLINSQELDKIFQNDNYAENDNNKENGCNTFLMKNIKFCFLNFQKINSITENCILITNILNQEKKKIMKFEKLLLRSDILNAYVFAPEQYKEKTQLKFKIILRFISNGKNIIFLQLFNKPRKNIYDDMDDLEDY
ncbi:hypothetical protein YYG_04306 [Plasmodium vinckei petteri]|uniref:Uncharacterized protein n=1 Tax=Plasmodium vinckei petteri TaxID=138298 RepID=W7AAT8_PLAVN|nr:hypothetical protein YYG_04306 [Plasmodium vinckei petteri]CAD2112043.1 conserved Plasmodium protein, unknown function [Plasmodium vinckei petteri]